MARARIYVSGPVTIGDTETNVRNACAATTKLIEAGYAVFCPHLSCYLKGPEACLSAGFAAGTWLEVDLAFVEVCHAVLRLPGESKGGDIEVEKAHELDIPVFYTVEALCAGINPVVEPVIKGDPRYHALLDDMAYLHAKKQMDYGSPGDPFANYRSSELIDIPAWKNAFMRATEKVTRIRSFIRNGKLTNEGVEDAFMDLAIGAMISLILYRETISQNK